MPTPLTKTYIKCKGCGKEIELKCGREYCIRCRNQIDKENATERRNNPEYHQMYLEKYKGNRR